MNNSMENEINIDENWYYAIVQNPGTPSEQFVGYRDEKTDAQFLPIFKNKQDAQKCFKLMPKDILNSKYEVQAVIEDDILSISKEHNYKIYLLNEEGSVYKEFSI